MHDDTKKALALVNEGADPNTRLEPTPAPSLKFLLQQVLHRSSFSPNRTPTALMLASGMRFEVRNEIRDNLDKPPQFPEDVPLVEAMLAHQASINSQAEDNMTALSSAVTMNQPHIVELLLTHGAHVNERDKTGSTELELAVLNGYPAIVRILLAHGADVNAQDDNGNTALHETQARASDADIVGQLMAHGADPMRRNKAGDSAFSYVQLLGRPDLLRLLKGGAK